MRYYIPLFALLIICVYSLSEARRGCCSHHGGVCGCGCCDGTPLSATCAPYYDCGESRTRPSRSDYDREEVIQLQTNLKKLGYYEGKVDGVPGNMTKNAIKLFQSKNGLDVTGVADSYTVQAIQDRVHNIVE
ncbi:MAG: peptidoglycan-binding protein [Tissierellales bacterium]|nr:peptidoglycan-binding protein [Tissierellales bacterium]